MVRLKQRYLLFDIIYPPSTDFNKKSNMKSFSESESDVLLELHQSSPSTINQKSLTQLIRRVIQDHFGDYGAGTTGMQMSVKYFSNKTSTGILKCGRSNFQTLVAALALINRINDTEVIVRCLHISGTIKKCEEFCIKRNKELMNLVSKGNSSQKLVNNMISQFETGNDVMNISDDENLD